MASTSSSLDWRLRTINMKSKRPPARKGLRNRVTVCARIDPTTKNQILLWMGGGISEGGVIDRVTSHAKRTHFQPNKDVL